MDDAREIKLIKSDRQLAADVVTSLVGLAVMYYVLNPNAVEDARAWVNRRINALAHRMSVWSATMSIRSLPETDET